MSFAAWDKTASAIRGGSSVGFPVTRKTNVTKKKKKHYGISFAVYLSTLVICAVRISDNKFSFSTLSRNDGTLKLKILDL